ncbi:MAG: CotH kinase family protein [Erysipelotrichaceae bacterium]|nr:CotH kinase family protein [Erysipelotrichaceae bacterium]
MDDDDWNTMLANPLSEDYYVCDVVINGQKIRNVGIRPKGNTSLSAIAMDPDNNRYSLKLEFDHFVKGQTYCGLDKLVLNNNYADVTNMKEAIIYDMYQYIGADASLYNYAKISVNGEYWGIYLALEGVEESFMLRNYGTQDGELYKPDSMEMGGSSSSGASSGSGGFQPGSMMPPSGSGDFPGSSSGFDPGNMPNGNGPDNMPDFNGMTPPPGSGDFPGGSSGFDPGSIPGGNGSDGPPDISDFTPSGNGAGFSMRGSGADLNYVDDDFDSYSTIWEGEITGTGNSDHRRVITALKNISEGNELETYMDVDNILKYMAVHTFAVNMDSLSGSMAHNYYLYEYDGQLNIIPWDYNLSFGGMSMGNSGDATEMVNDPIDTPFSSTHFFDALLENEEYLARYHGYLQQLVDEYVNGGRFDEVYNRIRNQIDELVKTDPNALYVYDEYLTAAEMLYETVNLRAESIRGQLNGTIPSTDAGQRKDSSSFVDASHIDVKAMGQFNMGGFSDNRKSRKVESDKTSSSSDSSFPSSGFSGFSGNSIPGSEGFSFDDSSGFNMENFTPGTVPNSTFGNTKLTNLAVYGLYMTGMLVLLLAVSRRHRKQ